MNATNNQIAVVVEYIIVSDITTKAQFAKDNGISPRTLGRWIDKHVEAAQQVIEARNNKKVVTSKNTTNKRAQASAVYAELAGTVTRKVLIAEMVGQVGLTAAGASTYISNFKTGKWAV